MTRALALAVMLGVGSEERVPLPWAVCARDARPGVKRVQVQFDSCWATQEEARARAPEVAHEGACCLIGDASTDEECPAGVNIHSTVENTEDAAYCQPLPPPADQK